MSILEIFLAIVSVLLTGVTVKTLILHASMGIQVDRAQQRATQALVQLDDLTVRIIHLESVTLVDEDEDENDQLHS